MVNFRRGTEALRVLLVDSEPAHCELIVKAFERHNKHLDEQGAPPGARCLPAGLPVQIEVVHSLREARNKLETSLPQLVIANRQLEDGDGLDLLADDGEPVFAVLLTSDKYGEQLAVEAIKAGAIDYVVKTAQALAAMPEIAAAALQEWGVILEHHRVQMEVVQMPQREQQRLGRELHDGLGQQLTGLGLLARSLTRRLEEGDSREREMAEQLASGLEQALAELRTLARGLIPVHTDARGLVSALEELALRISEQSGIRVELRHENPILISDNEIATHVYRIVQEAINNSVKHAQADNIVLLLEADEHEAVIEVRDNGKGLPDDVDEKCGLGLRTMFHRCRLFGGNLDVYTHEEGGTRVRCCFPLAPEKKVS
jgi:signal transduction histidine kinase